MEVNSIEELVEAGINDLQILANVGNMIAQRWLYAIQNQPIVPMKLKAFGEMKIALMNDESAEAKQVYAAMFPERIEG